MTTARFEHTAELLPGGGVFVANGLGGPSDRTEPALVLDSGETFDPVTGRWTTASLEVSRYAATSALLADGRVLLYGGLTIDANNQVAPAIVATVFNPLTNAVDGAFAVDPPRARHTATRVPDGTVLIVGGGTRGGSADNADSDTAEFTDTPTDCVVDRTARFSTVIVSLSQRRHRHTATLLPDGSALIAGGVGAAGPAAHRSLTDAWRYALPKGASAALAGYWVWAGELTEPRGAHTATLLGNGTVLVTGGADFATGTILDSAELFFLKFPNLSGCTWPSASLMLATAGMIFERHFRRSRGQGG